MDFDPRTGFQSRFGERDEIYVGGNVDQAGGREGGDAGVGADSAQGGGGGFGGGAVVYD